MLDMFSNWTLFIVPEGLEHFNILGGIFLRWMVGKTYGHYKDGMTCSRNFHAYTNKKNACRALHRLVEHAGVTLPLSMDAVQITIKRMKPLGEFKTWWPFLSMQTWANYLLQNCPGMLLGGYALSNPLWKQTMRLFWGAYQSIDPAHFIYASDYSWDTMIPYCFHGDEGRGSGRVPFLVMSWQPIVSHKGMDQCNDSSQL